MKLRKYRWLMTKSAEYYNRIRNGFELQLPSLWLQRRNTKPTSIINMLRIELTITPWNGMSIIIYREGIVTIPLNPAGTSKWTTWFIPTSKTSE
jgi:hypothetical protein